MFLYGIASALSGDVEDWYLSREEAEAVLAGILRDEPDFEGEVWVEAVELRRGKSELVGARLPTPVETLV
jgi:hypothetical protein